MAPTRENMAPQVIQRVAREIRQLVQAPPNGITYLPQDEEVLTDIRVEIAGPENTPYEGGFFQVKLALSDGFPQTPPKGVFLTKIFHPNIATNGEICVNTLKKDWTPSLGIAHVLQVIRCLLIVPFPESSLNDEAGRLFMDSYDEYARRAKLLTDIHARKQSAAKTQDKPTAKQATSTGARTESAANNASGGVAVVDTEKEKEQREPETSEASAGVAKISTSEAGAPTLAKKRASPTSTDALAAQKKKSTLKKGIKRL